MADEGTAAAEGVTGATSAGPAAAGATSGAGAIRPDPYDRAVTDPRMRLVPARYVGEYQKRLSRDGGPYYDAEGQPLTTLLLGAGDTLLIPPAEAFGETHFYDRANDQVQWLGWGRVVKPEHRTLTTLDQLIAAGYMLTEARSDFEPLVQPAHIIREQGAATPWPPTSASASTASAASAPAASAPATTGAQSISIAALETQMDIDAGASQEQAAADAHARELARLAAEAPLDQLQADSVTLAQILADAPLRAVYEARLAAAAAAAPAAPVASPTNGSSASTSGTSGSGAKGSKKA